MQNLPNEILLRIFNHISIPKKTHLISTTCKKWYILEKASFVNIGIILSLNEDSNYIDSVQLFTTFPEFLTISKHSCADKSPFSSIFPSIIHSDIWLHFHTQIFDMDLIKKSICNYIRSHLKYVNFKLVFIRLVKKFHLTDYVDEALEFQELTICSPSPHSIDLISNSQIARLKVLDFIAINSELNLENFLENNWPINTISFHSTGKLLNDIGVYRASCFQPLLSLPSLSTLNFSGPWLKTMIDTPLPMLSIIKSLNMLTNLVIDLDYQELGANIIIDLFTSLPFLKTFGRLGRVDNSFWRQCPKAVGFRLQKLIIGTVKYTFSSRLTINPAFFKDMAMGVLWFAPSIKHLEVWMGFHADTDALLEALSRIKQGPSWDLDPNIKQKQLQKIHVFQSLDLNSLDDRSWKLLAEIPRSTRLEICLTRQDSLFEGFVKKFGQAIQ